MVRFAVSVESQTEECFVKEVMVLNLEGREIYAELIMFSTTRRAEGSPGQRTAALLAFLLSYGDEPLILDQPEDDLGNLLIYDLIVTQLRNMKRSRQIVVVTHNANIVVNGDAELVVALAPYNGETKKEWNGSFQEKEVREAICAIMEGGTKAFENCY